MTSVFNRALRILLTTNGVILLAAALLGPIIALYVERIGGTLLDAGISGGIFALVAALTTLVIGRLTDRVREPELIVVAGYMLMGIGFLLFVFVQSIAALFIVQGIIGFAEALYSPAFDALYSHHTARRNHGRVWGAWESTMYFVTGIGALAGGAIAYTFGFMPIFFLMAGLCFGSALYIFFLPRRVL